MAELYKSKAWRVAHDIFTAPGVAPPVPAYEMGWLSGFVGLIRPALEADASQLLNLPTPKLRYRFANSYGEYVSEWLGRFSPERLNGADAESLGRRVATEATRTWGAYWSWSEEVWFVAPNLLAASGPDRREREATVYMTGGHETVHGALRQGVPWLRDYMSTLFHLSRDLSANERRELSQRPHPLIPTEAYSSRDVAHGLWDTVVYSDEGTSETMSWGLVDRGIERGMLQREAARTVLKRRVVSLNQPALETYGTGVFLPAKAIGEGREGIDRFWRRPVTKHEVARLELWLGTSDSWRGGNAEHQALPVPRQPRRSKNVKAS